MAILDDLASQLQQGDTLSQLSRQLGTDEQTTAQAVSMALPMLVGGLAQNAQSPQGAQSLHDALQNDHDGSVLDDLPSFLSGAQPASATPRALNGAGILGHILGGGRAPVEAGIGKATGLNGQQVGRLLMMLAPLVMAYLGRRQRTAGMDPGGLGSVLAGERDEIERRAPGAGGILGQILGGAMGGGGADQPGIADDLARMAPNILGGLGGMFGGRRG